jgi:quercetin dioxygenase-like cupin family protein
MYRAAITLDEEKGGGMKGKILRGLVCLLAAGPVFAQAADHKAVVMPAADVKWVDMVGGPPGIMIAPLWGDYQKGAFGALIKFPAGASAPLHTHTSDMRIVVVSGTFIHGPEGKTPVRLGPGSYLMQAGGSYRHTTACDKASDCVMFADGRGKFDIHMVEAKK